MTQRTATPRERRRQQTLEEILDVALDVMGEYGVAALNLTEVARRVGLRQPSLYQYFASRTAVYDAVFERGMGQHLTVVRDAVSGSSPGFAGARAAMVATIRFSVENPVLSQFLFTSAVPGFVPSPGAYAPAVAAQELVQAALDAAVERGELRKDAAAPGGRSLLFAMTAGVASMQLANDAGASFQESRFAPLIEPAMDMYAAYFAPSGES